MIETLPHTENWSPQLQKIHGAAAQMFSRYGYPGTSIRALAQSIGLEGSSLYSHIKNKQELLYNICFLSAEKYSAGLREILEAKQSPLATLEAVVDLHVDIALNIPSSMVVFNDEWRHLEEPALWEFISMRKNYEKQVIEIIEIAQKKNIIKRLSPSILFNTLVASLQWIYQAPDDESGIAPRILKQELKTILFYGIKNNDT